jgi:hypothetical protein
MAFTKLYRPILHGIALLFSIAWLLFMMLHNEVPVDVGDGVTHYFISAASWKDPILFLHHWGKPFFILLSSPFTQFGFNGGVVFNILVFSASIIIGFKILERKNVSIWLQLLFPLVLLKAHDVAGTLLGGLTEPLFNLAILAAIYFLVERKWLLFAVLVSFMPFMRSEGQLPVILAASLICFFRQFKILPFLLTGFVLYGIVGWFMLKDPFWYFTHNPYDMANAIYGKGPWYHYITSYKNYLGNPGLYVLILGVPAMVYFLIKKKWNLLHIELLVFSAGIFFGIIAAHSYFWATGQNGSLGLTRIATQGMPAFLLINLYYIDKLKWMQSKIAKGIVIAASLGLVTALVTTKYFPKKADPLDRQVLKTADYLHTLDLKGKKVFYHFPLLSFAYGANNFDPNEKTFVTYAGRHFDEDLGTLIQPGDLIIRDSHFGPMEMYLPLSKVDQNKNIVKIAEFISSEQKEDPYNETECVVVYQYVPFKKQYEIKAKIDTIEVNKTFEIGPSNEFTTIDDLFPGFKEDTKVTITLMSTTDGLELTYDYNQLEDYSNTLLQSNKEVSNTYLFRKAGVTKLYIWNPKKVKGKVLVKRLIIENTSYHPFQKN